MSNELTPIELENNLGPDVNGVVHHVPWKAYDVDEVDTLLAKKDKEIAELKAKLEDVQASMYADVVDANMENRRLRRALYKACANWAIFRACILEYFCIKINAKKWERMYHKCRAKAEEYK